MNQDSGLTRIIRGLTWTGTIFLVLTAIAIVWAVFRTRGIDDLITALTITGLGFGLPAVVAFVVAWLLGTFDDAEADGREDRAHDAVTDTRAAFPVLSYFVAIAAVGVAWALRAWLSPRNIADLSLESRWVCRRLAASGTERRGNHRCSRAPH